MEENRKIIDMLNFLAMSDMLKKSFGICEKLLNPDEKL